MVGLDGKTSLRLWRFVRGDDPARAFEEWAYRERSLEAQLGEELYMEAVSTDFGDRHAVWSLRERLGRFLRAEPDVGCYCVRLRDRDVVDMGTFQAPTPAFATDRDYWHEEILGTLDMVREAGKPRWWLAAVRCSACGQAWLMAQESRHNDVYVLQRLTPGDLQSIEDDGRWPSDFDRYEELISIGRTFGRAVDYVDPLGSMELLVTMADIARERPGIRLSELAGLLDLDSDVALLLARRVADEEGVAITIDLP